MDRKPIQDQVGYFRSTLPHQDDFVDQRANNFARYLARGLHGDSLGDRHAVEAWRIGPG